VGVGWYTVRDMNTGTVTTATCTTTLLAKAEALIASGGLAATDRPGVYRATSSDGKRSYLCSAQFCFCPAGERGQSCKHRLAAQVKVADAQRARAAARGIVVLHGEPGELLAPDRELDLYGNGDDITDEGE
jgi:hypothetical protein